MRGSVVEKYLTVREVAELAGVQPSTIRAYRKRGHMPEPDMRYGREPGWLAQTIQDWINTRPGRGHRSDLE